MNKTVIKAKQIRRVSKQGVHIMKQNINQKKQNVIIKRFIFSAKKRA
jgi:hypothetical protein